MLEKSKKHPYEAPHSGERLNSLIIDLQIKFVHACFAKFFTAYSLDKATVDKARSNALWEFKNLLNKVEGYESLYGTGLMTIAQVANNVHKSALSIGSNNVESWFELLAEMHDDLHGKYDFRSKDPRTGEMSVSEEHVRQLYDSLVVETCEHFRPRSALTTLFDKTITLAGAVNLNPKIADESFGETLWFLNLAVGWRICQDIRGLDRDLLVKRLTKHINDEQKESSFWEIDAQRLEDEE